MKYFCIAIEGLLHQLKKEHFREVFEYHLRRNGTELQQKSIITESNIELLKEVEKLKITTTEGEKREREKGEFRNRIMKN